MTTLRPTALVTGASRGLGKAIAIALAGAGYDLAIAARTMVDGERRLEGDDSIVVPGGLDTTASAIEERGGAALPLYMDVLDRATVVEAVPATVAEFGRLDVVVNNAIYQGPGAMVEFLDLDDHQIETLFEGNLFAQLGLLHAAIPAMVEAGGGSFGGMSSIAGHVTHPYFGASTVGKAGIEEMMKNAADEMGPSHIRFNSIRPGFIATEIMEGVPRESDVYGSYIENTPMQGVGESEDVAHLARFLIGRESRWVTGCAINVDGGHALRRGPNFQQFIEPAIG